MLNAANAIVCMLIVTPWAILAYYLLKNRRTAIQPMIATPVPVPTATLEPVAAHPSVSTTKPAPAVVHAIRPRRKLFLSWAAVDRALRTGEVSESDLATCLFCTSEAENGLAQEFNADRYEELLPHFQRAGKEGRLICPRGTRYYNRTTLAEVNRMLERNGLSRLFVADDSSTLEQIPIYSCVPRVENPEEIEVMWAAHPYRGNWKSCWGAHTDDSAPEDDGDNNEDTGEDLYRRPSWLDKENKPILDAYRARHPEDFIQPKPDVRDEDDGEGNEPWRESLRGDNGEEEVEGNEAWRESLRPDTDEERRNS